MDITMIMEFLKPELLVLVPVLYLIGMGLKRWGVFSNSLIPVMLGVFGIALAAIWVLATSEVSGWQSALLAAFTAIVQGVLCAGASVYVNQVYQQAKRAY